MNAIDTGGGIVRSIIALLGLLNLAVAAVRSLVTALTGRTLEIDSRFASSPSALPSPAAALHSMPFTSSFGAPVLTVGEALVRRFTENTRFDTKSPAEPGK